jgi:hypothetical protein
MGWQTSAASSSLKQRKSSWAYNKTQFNMYNFVTAMKQSWVQKSKALSRLVKKCTQNAYLYCTEMKTK